MRVHSERIEVDLTLVTPQSAEDNELQVVFTVTASALVREFRSEPGELLIEDIEITSVGLMSLSMGRFGAMWPSDTTCRSMVALENQRRLDWLNSQLDDNDHWTERIKAAVLAKHDSALAVY